MSKIVDHIADSSEAPSALRIRPVDEPTTTNLHHAYRIGGFDGSENPSVDATSGIARSMSILFQNGPIKEAGANGVTEAALLAVLIHRYRCFHSAFPSRENSMTLTALENAMEAMHRRTRDRLRRGVEGTSKE